MLFNSTEFILIFLPVTVLGYFCLAKINYQWATGFLVVASLVFYGWWDIRFVPLLIASATFNFGLGRVIVSARSTSVAAAKRWLFGAVGANLMLLAIFKYSYFFATNISLITGAPLDFPNVVLPLGISFFTFTQVAYLVDAYQGKTREYDFLKYLLFVTYFPHLIAGPILHHKEMMPQFGRPDAMQMSARNFALGLSVFAFGLFKKVVLADSLSGGVGAVFDAAETGSVTFLEAWFGAIAYTLQLYLDFSAYCEMALGLSLLFGVRLPLNFFSPYRATNIIDFWRRWHMTLSRFLRDYLYIPLGGNRLGAARRYVNLLVTMTLGGLWHGAAWTFVLWGLLHGVYLATNHAWRLTAISSVLRTYLWWKRVSHGLTLLAVIIGWVLFRSTSVDGALNILEAMFLPERLEYPSPLDTRFPTVATVLQMLGFSATDSFSPAVGMSTLGIVAVLSLLVLFGRNIPEIFGVEKIALPSRISLETAKTPFHDWKPTVRWAALSAAIALLAISLMHRQSEFLYYQF